MLAATAGQRVDFMTLLCVLHEELRQLQNVNAEREFAVISAEAEPGTKHHNYTACDF